MSKAFTKEDDDEPPERSGRVRASSGLPPGALNYLTAAGARRLREEREKLAAAVESGGKPTRRQVARAAELERILASATIVPAMEEPADEVLFGAEVTVRRAHGKLTRLHIVGVDEIAIHTGDVSWVSPMARALFGHRVGERVPLGDDGADEVDIVKIEYAAAERGAPPERA